jgi:outer membrane biosynthesis protein TonB
MGLLDDAIREHLELKRRHGADPGEVARQESEALGPARRAAEMAQAQPEVEHEPEPDFDFEPEPDPEPVFEPEPEPEPEPVARTIDQPTVEHPSAKPEPMIEDDAEDCVFGDDASQSDASSESEGEDGDVLEGTPEFLEETPEHDRLWFEQRPPRDFDFDD